MKSILKSFSLAAGIFTFVAATQFSALTALTQWRVVESAPLQNGAIEVAAFERGAVARAVLAMAYEHGEYARFEKGGMTAEIAFDTANDEGNEISLPYGRTIQRMLEGWNAVRGRIAAYGEEGSIGSGWNEIVFIGFQRNDGRTCVGFLHEWDHPAPDPENHLGKLLFGYMCKTQDQPLSREEIATFMGSIDISWLDNASGLLPSHGRYESDRLAMRIAGPDGRSSGHRDFPFDYGFPYQQDEGSEPN